MADQLVKTGAHGEQLYVRYSTSQSIENNRSTVYVSMWIRIPAGWNVGPWGDYGGSYVGRSWLTFSGGIGNIAAGDHTLSDTMSFTVDHNADGTGSTSIEWKWGVNSSWGGFVKPSGSFSISLPTIPRATTPSLSADTVEMGAALTVTTAGASDAFTHRLLYSWHDSGWQEIANGVKSRYIWTVPLTFANSIPSSTSSWGTIRCETYNGTTLIGSKDVKFTAKVPDSIKPTCSCTIADATACYAAYGAFVQSKSKLKVSISAGLAYGSPIKSYNVTFEDKRYTDQNTTTDPISGAGTLSVQIAVTDNRGRQSDTVTKTVSVLEYKEPVITLSAYRCTAAGVRDPKGAYMKIAFSAVIAKLNDQNAASFQIRYKASGVEQWTQLNGTGTTYASDPLECTLDSPWNVETTVTDSLGSTTAAATIPVAFTLLDVYRDGTGISFGGVATGPGMKCHMAADFVGSLTVQGQPLLDYLKASLTDFFLPVGFILMTESAEFNPNTAYPGTTWTRIKDRFILAAGDTYAAGSTGGEAEVTLSVMQMPNHDHGERMPAYGYEGWDLTDPWPGYSDGYAVAFNYGNSDQYKYSTPLHVAHVGSYGTNTTDNGGSQPHNNMPPYAAKYVWERTA